MSGNIRKRYLVNLVTWDEYEQWIEASSADEAQERAIEDYAEHGDLHFKLKNANVECMGVWDEDDITANAGTPQS